MNINAIIKSHVAETAEYVYFPLYKLHNLKVVGVSLYLVQVLIIHPLR